MFETNKQTNNDLFLKQTQIDESNVHLLNLPLLKPFPVDVSQERPTAAFNLEDIYYK